MLFVLRDVADLASIRQLPGFEDATPDLVEAVLEEAAQLASEVIAPTNPIGDAEGTRVDGAKVRVPEAFRKAYQQFMAGGWGGISMSPEAGGQGLPYLVGMAVEEMWQAANLAWSLCPLLTQGAARAIEAHADDTLKALLLPNMVSGEWTGTMNLTEPQSGSDLATVRTVAVPDGEHFRITGQKIYITWGDHDMTGNVVHLVLARLPDAPEGVRGISLFAVPKFLIAADGSPGARNLVSPVSVEHKLGIHGSPTCVMAFDEALGYLVGEPNRGLAAMFTMMNHARLGVGLEGVAVAERAYQQAAAYARDRVQGQPPGRGPGAPIIGHPDVRRMLMTMRAQIEAMRSLAYVAGAHLDRAHRAPAAAERARHQARVDLLTPIVKGWCTESAQHLTSLAIQVHGGMGYVEETGVAQHYRDVRITTIYEGTTGIQANDLVGRKTLRDGGEAFRALLDDMRAADAELAEAGDALADVRQALARGAGRLAGAVDWVVTRGTSDPAGAGGAGYYLLMLAGTVAGGWQLARGALAAWRRLEAGDPDLAFCRAKVATARYYAGHIMPFADAYAAAIEAGPDVLMELGDEQF
jgi:alkylation response protein AidB-like acyl-CoA dehydrogenase